MLKEELSEGSGPGWRQIGDSDVWMFQVWQRRSRFQLHVLDVDEHELAGFAVRKNGVTEIFELRYSHFGAQIIQAQSSHRGRSMLYFDSCCSGVP